MNELWQTHLAAVGARFDERGLATFPGVRAAGDGRLAPLAHLTLIRINGPDAAGFLQGQLTSDVSALVPGAWQWAGYCNPKGRLLATMRLARTGEGFLAEAPAAIVPDLVSRLRKFVLRAKVVLVSEEPPRVGVGVQGTEPAAALSSAWGHPLPEPAQAADSGGVFVIGAGRARWHFYVDPAKGVDLWMKLAPHASPLSTDAWAGLDLAEGVPWIVPETQALFVPQMVDFERLGGVSFAKGCYPGQEIVARSQYLGEVKRRLFQAVNSERLAAGAPLTGAVRGEQTIGTVLASAPLGEGRFQVLAVIDVEGAAGTVTASAGTALQRLTPVHPQG